MCSKWSAWGLLSLTFLALWACSEEIQDQSLKQTAKSGEVATSQPSVQAITLNAAAVSGKGNTSYSFIAEASKTYKATLSGDSVAVAFYKNENQSGLIGNTVSGMDGTVYAGVVDAKESGYTLRVDVSSLSVGQTITDVSLSAGSTMMYELLGSAGKTRLITLKPQVSTTNTRVTNADGTAQIVICNDKEQLTCNDSDVSSTPGLKNVVFEATKHGANYVFVSANDNITFDLMYTAPKEMTLGTEEIEQKLTGREVKLYSLKATKGNAYNITLTKAAGDITLVAYQEATAAVEASTTMGNKIYLTFTATETATYVVQVTEAGQGEAVYKLMYTEAAKSAPDATSGTLVAEVTVSPASSQTHTISVEKDMGYRVTVTPSKGAISSLAILDQSRGSVASQTDNLGAVNGLPRSKVFLATYTGTYYIEVTGDSVEGVTYNLNFSKAVALPAAGTPTSPLTLDYGTVALYSVPVTAGLPTMVEYTLSSGTPGNLNSGQFTTSPLYGSVNAPNPVSSLWSATSVTHLAQASGTMYVFLSNGNKNYSTDASALTLTLKQIPVTDGGALTLGTAKSENMDAKSMKLYTIAALNTNRVYTLSSNANSSAFFALPSKAQAIRLIRHTTPFGSTSAGKGWVFVQNTGTAATTVSTTVSESPGDACSTTLASPTTVSVGNYCIAAGIADTSSTYFIQITPGSTAAHKAAYTVDSAQSGTFSALTTTVSTGHTATSQGTAVTSGTFSTSVGSDVFTTNLTKDKAYLLKVVAKTSTVSTFVVGLSAATMCGTLAAPTSLAIGGDGCIATGTAPYYAKFTTTGTSHTLKYEAVSCLTTIAVKLFSGFSATSEGTEDTTITTASPSCSSSISITKTDSTLTANTDYLIKNSGDATTSVYRVSVSE